MNYILQMALRHCEFSNKVYVPWIIQIAQRKGLLPNSDVRP